jgi:DNA-binding transcriptional MerR regulator
MINQGMPIGKICELAECTPRTVRHYENEGLIRPATTTPGGRKLYGAEAVSIIRMAQVLKRIHYSIKDIRRVLALASSGDTKSRRLTDKLRGILQDLLSRIDSETERLASAREKISGLLEKTQKCEQCRAPDCSTCGRVKALRTLGLLVEKDTAG